MVDFGALTPEVNSARMYAGPGSSSLQAGASAANALAATPARAAAAAHEQAFAAPVPPPLIAANRAQTAAAVQANVFGQYTPLISQLEAPYGEMWAQDSAAMYGYAGQSASAAQVTPFASPA